MPTLNKLEYLDETKQQIKNALNTKFNSGITDSDTFRSYVDKIRNIYTNWPKVTGEDTELSLTPTKKGLMSLILKSNTSQDAEPSPDNPQDIHVVSGDNNVKVENKNLFNKDTANYNKGIDSSGNLGNNNNLTTSDYIQIQPNTSYYLSNTIGSNYGRCCAYYDNSKTFISIESKTGQAIINTSITTPSNAKYMRVACATGNESILQVEKGTTATSYVPHQEQNYPLTLGELEYCKIGDYEDLFFKNVVGSTYYDSTLELDKWYLKKKIYKKILDGTEVNLTLQSINAYGIANFKWTHYLKTVNSQVLCDKLLKQTTSISQTTSEGILWQIDDTYIRLDEDRVSTVEDFRTWLSTNNLTTYSVLETPTNILLNSTLQTQLDNIAKAISYQEQTNISQTNDDLPFIISASALMKGGN